MIIDTFLFWDELDLLELRLRELDGTVDEFIAIQGAETFAGIAQEPSLDLDAPRWALWRGRLRSVVAGRYPEAPCRWTRENAQREAVRPLLDDYPDDALVLHEDADEIPNAETVRYWATRMDGRWVGFRLKLFYYYLNLRCMWGWSGIALTTLGTFRRHGPNYFRDRRKAPDILTAKEVGGWHFSYLGGVAAIQRKLSAWPHEEFDTPVHRDPVRLADAIVRRRDPFGQRPRVVFHPVELNELPADVQAHPDRYRHLLLPESV